MEARLGTDLHNFYGPVASEAMGKKSMEWDLNEWRWDGDLFMAAPLNYAPSDCRSKQFFPVGADIPVNNGACISISSGSDEAMFENERENRDLEKRRRIENEQVNEEGGSLNLKLGGQVYPITEGELDKLEGQNGKKTKVAGAPSNHPVCQVENCKANLSNAKDYHRRHKVCGVHSKATSALVGSVMQRFCQQCSRFHVLQEFDEGKRSCRRRLAGHNKRRRKTHPENENNAATLNDERGSNYLLITLLRILTNMQSNSYDQAKDQDLLSHFLKNLANVAGTADGRNRTGLLPVSHGVTNAGASLATADPTRAGDLSNKGIPSNNFQVGVRHNESASQPAVQFLAEASNLVKENVPYNKAGSKKLNNFDLNNPYDGSEDRIEDARDTIRCDDNGNFSPAEPLWLRKDSQQSSPPHISGNSGSTSSQSPSTSSGEAQSRTDRIVFKLFGKDPSDFPLVLRKQILDWLANSPTEIESYIRPGCIILTIYLRMDESTWEELHCNLSSSLERLLDSSTDSFWKTGWIYTRVRNRVTFVYNGQVVLDTPLPLQDDRCCRISSIKPIAVTVSDTVKFVIKGINLSRPTSRLLCALEGKYLFQENCADMEGSDLFVEQNEIQSLSFSSVLPNIIGRGFIEVEDHVLSSSFFPFIVAEKDVCSEIRTLESIIEAAEINNEDTNNLEFRNQALDFINEMGWLLHKTQLKLRLGETNDAFEPFPFKRFKWLIEFSIDHDWYAVVKKLLSVLFDGTVDSGQYDSVLLALQDIGLLHKAVRRNCRSMVEFLLKYRSSEGSDKTGPVEKYSDNGYYLFRPDAAGPGGLTPVHIAASLDNCDNVLDALIEDPGQVGIKAWKDARDSTGLTPHDYACFRGNYSYVNLVQRKLENKSKKEHIILDIPCPASNGSVKPKTGNSKFTAFDTEANNALSSRSCGQCERKLAHGSYRASLTIYRPTMLSMVAIAAVCVCAALLFKSSPEVLCSLGPFRWELLDYGAQ